MQQVAFIIHWICILFVSKKGIKGTKKGKNYIEKLDAKTLGFLEWRSISSIREDLKNVSNFFGKTTIVGFGVYTFLLFFKVEPGLYFVISICITLFGWSALKWGINKRKETIEWLKFIGLFVCSPWVMLLFDSINDSELKLLPYFSESIRLFFGLKLSPGIETALVMTVILLIGMLLTSLFWFIQNLVVLYFFILCLWIINQFSKLILKVNEDDMYIFIYLLLPISWLVMNYK